MDIYGYIICLVLWNHGHFMVPFSWEFHHPKAPNDEVHHFSQGFKPPTSIGGLIREAGVWSLSSLSSGSLGSLTGWVNTYEIQASTGCLNMVNWKVLALKSPLSKMMHGGYCRVGQNHTHSISINHHQKYERYMTD